MIKRFAAMTAAALTLGLPLAAFASDDGSSTLQDYYGTFHIGFGALHYSNGGSLPQLHLSSNNRFGNFFLGSGANLAFGRIDGLKADRYSFDLRPGWIYQVSKNLDIVPYARAGANFQDVYQGALRDPTSASLKLGYALGGGIGVNWSPINRLVISPRADVSYYRQDYGHFKNSAGKRVNKYLSTTEYREKLNVSYYVTRWLSLGVYVGADQFGSSNASLVSYGGMLGLNF